MTTAVELRRHTDNDGDSLTPEGVRAALDIGRGLRGNYELLVSSGMQRATQTLACFLAALGEAAVLALTGRLIGPVAKGAGVLVVEDGGAYRVEALDERR